MDNLKEAQSVAERNVAVKVDRTKFDGLLKDIRNEARTDSLEKEKKMEDVFGKIQKVHELQS